MRVLDEREREYVLLAALFQTDIYNTSCGTKLIRTNMYSYIKSDEMEL